MPNRSVDLSSWERSACYPRSTFLSFERRPFHSVPPDHFALLSHLIDLSVSPVKHACANALRARLPFVLSVPWEASVTLLEATTPVKLPPSGVPSSGLGAHPAEGWYFNSGSSLTGVRDSLPPTYPTHPMDGSSAKVQ